MKPIFTLLTLATLFCQVAISQETTDIVTVNSGRIDQPEYAFYVRGDNANLFLEGMFSTYPKTKRSGYIHKFKKIGIKNIIGGLTIQINEGVHGSRDNCSSYFNTFDSERYRTERLGRITENEILGVIIYVKKNDGKFIATEYEAELFRGYIRSFFTK